MARTRARRVDGDRTRSAITAAAVSLIAQQGLAGTTQRKVATRAGVSLAAVTYHFASLEDLFDAAFDRIIDDSVARLDRLRQSALAGRTTLAQAWAEVVRGEDDRTRDEVVGSYELLVAAIRRPQLRPSATRLLDALNSFFLAWTPAPDPARSVLSLLLGLSLTEAASGRPLGQADLSGIFAVLGMDPNQTACPSGRRDTCARPSTSSKGTQPCPSSPSSEPDRDSAAPSPAGTPVRATTSS
ncbi:MAG: TetR family transcriptional regulator [Propionicimonas sp.]|uniref:TetR/AcrR family transcriptional regulator n=1 Tax=Propionicimonas sp. TaxID=1955623 RepID=UPI002B20EFF5|nr:TetR family transcriptional regulator [Propionicimonas sp.]MEA4944430.1 TetR family transcriptional regulator [Propionicimonas sp.]